MDYSLEDQLSPTAFDRASQDLHQIPITQNSPPGKRLGKYILQREIARGGMAIVFEAEDPDLKRRVAVKVLKDSFSEDGISIRLHREAAIAAQLRHPNIVGIHEVGMVTSNSEPTTHFIVMDYVEGQTLAAVLHDKKTPRPQLLHLLEEVAQAVSYAHSKGVIHRDLKPSNVLVERNHRALLTDFGIARADFFHTQLTRSQEILGTPQYMAPEQVDGKKKKIDARTDVYALGVMLYEVLTGHAPFSANTHVELFRKILMEEPVPPRRDFSSVPRELELICLKALEKNPLRRYQNVVDFAEDLACFRRNEPIRAQRPSAFYRLRKHLRRNPWAYVGATSAALMLFLPGIWMVLNSKMTHENSKKDEAYKFMDAGRTALERAVHALYNPEANTENVTSPLRDAQKLLEQAVEKVPDIALEHHLLGRVWEMQGEYDRAEISWRTAIHIDENMAPAQYSLGRLLMIQADRSMEVAGPQSPETRKKNALKKTEEGIRAIEKALNQSHGLDDPLRRKIASAMLERMQQRVQQGEISQPNWSRELIQIADEKFRGRKGVEELYWLAGLRAHPKEGILQIERALKICPNFVLALRSRGALRKRNGNREGALADFNKVLHFHPRDLHIRIERGVLLYESGNPQGAIEEYNKVLHINPNLIEAYNNRGFTKMMKLKDYKGAIEDFTKAIALTFQKSQMHINRGYAFELQGNRRMALQDYTAALKFLPINKTSRKDWLKGKIKEVKSSLESE